ncbi:MAG: glycosyltransferase family protein [Candidatus Omnitrophica bacterium]|nr:glycosyltransferase family protein [Candidatus Omnitrophota bacterium]
MKKASVIIQARMGASRLPNKVLLPLAGKPVLEHVIRRCQHAKRVDQVIVATTIDSKDLAVVNFVSHLGVGVFCGSVNDVLDRYYQTAKLFQLQHIVRITADCPMIDPDIIDRVIGEYFTSSADYATNTLQLTYPDGEDVEVFSADILHRAWGNAKMLSEREHVTPYIKKSDAVRKVNVLCENDHSSQRWTLDEPRDYEKLSAIYDALYQKDAFFSMKDVLEFLDEHPGIDRMNDGIIRNEGYQKSLAQDREVA